jgi:hypothetical protein
MRRRTTFERLSWIAALPCAALLVFACGPSVAVDDASAGAGSSSTTADTSASTASSTTAGSTTTAGPADSSSASGFTTGAPSDGSTFIVPPDAGPSVIQCDDFLQDCPPGQKCMPYASDGGEAWNATRCVDVVDDPHAAGEPCTMVRSPWSGEDDCDGASMCFGVDPETLQGTCTSFCRGSDVNPLCPEPCDVCPIAGDGVLNLCLQRCDLLLQDCANGWACLPVLGEVVCVPSDPSPGAGIGTPCEYVNACPPSMVCVAAELVPGCGGGIGCCTALCPVGGEDPCPALAPGTTCAARFDAPPPEGCAGAPAGMCVLPS